MSKIIVTRDGLRTEGQLQDEMEEAETRARWKKLGWDMDDEGFMISLGPDGTFPINWSPEDA